MTISMTMKLPIQKTIQNIITVPTCPTMRVTLAINRTETLVHYQAVQHRPHRHHPPTRQQRGYMVKAVVNYRRVKIRHVDHNYG